MSKSSKWIVAAASIGLAAATSSSALAQERQEPSYIKHPVRAPVDALEIGVGAAYSQGTMSPAAGIGATDLTKAGGAFSLQLGYRFTPLFALHLTGEYDEFTPGNGLASSAATRGGVGGISGMFHILPYQRVDPWVRVGAGYRMLWVTDNADQPDTRWDGFQAKVDIGADLRTSEDVAIGPTIGVGLTEFVWTDPSGSVGMTEIQGKRVTPFVYAGLEARFDAGGARKRPLPDLASR